MKNRTRIGVFGGTVLTLVAVGMIAASSAQAASSARLYAGKNYSDVSWSTTSQSLKVTTTNYDKTCDNLHNGVMITVLDSAGKQVYTGSKDNSGLGCGKHNSGTWTLSAGTLGANGKSGTLKMMACGGNWLENCYDSKTVYYTLK